MNRVMADYLVDELATLLPTVDVSLSQATIDALATAIAEAVGDTVLTQETGGVAGTPGPWTPYNGAIGTNKILLPANPNRTGWQVYTTSGTIYWDYGTTCGTSLPYSAGVTSAAGPVLYASISDTAQITFANSATASGMVREWTR